MRSLPGALSSRGHPLSSPMASPLSHLCMRLYPSCFFSQATASPVFEGRERVSNEKEGEEEGTGI